MNENAPSPSRPKEATFLWRRAAAITAIAALIIVPSVLLFINETRGGGGTKKVAIPPTPNAARDAKLGIAVGWPDGWHLSRKRGDFKLISDDRTSAFLVSSPAPAKQAIGVFTSALKAVSAKYGKRQVRFVKGSVPVAGLPAETALISGKSKRGVPENVVLSIVRGRTRTYVVEAIVAQKGGRPGDVALISRALRLSR